MTIPDFQSIMMPMLQVLADGRKWSASAPRGELAKRFRLTPSEVAELQPSGRTQVFSNRMHWARLYLDSAGLIKTPRRGTYYIAPRGREARSSELLHVVASSGGPTYRL